MINMETHPDYFQEYMEENVCFGCGKNNPEGLQIKSYWEGDTCICIWNSQQKYNGWTNLLNGGILATLVDCHCMATATSYAYQQENNRAWNSEPVYRYATGTMTIKYLKPTSNNLPIRLEAKIREVKNKKTTVQCTCWSGGIKTAEAEVIAIRVYDSSLPEDGNNPFKS